MFSCTFGYQVAASKKMQPLLHSTVHVRITSNVAPLGGNRFIDQAPEPLKRGFSFIDLQYPFQ